MKKQKLDKLIPSKEEMIAAVKKSSCPRLNQMPVDYMSQIDLYTHLVESNCPCLKRLMEHKK